MGVGDVVEGDGGVVYVGCVVEGSDVVKCLLFVCYFGVVCVVLVVVVGCVLVSRVVCR